MSMNRDMMAKLAQMQERLAKAQADLAEARKAADTGRLDDARRTHFPRRSGA